MARYLSTLDLSADAYKGLVTNPHNRMDAAAPLFQSIGATLEHYWFGVGETFVYVVFSAPNNSVDLQALTMTVLSSGIVSNMTTRQIITADEGMASAQKAAQLTYRPPTAA